MSALVSRDGSGRKMSSRPGLPRPQGVDNIDATKHEEAVTALWGRRSADFSVFPPGGANAAKRALL